MWKWLQFKVVDWRAQRRWRAEAPSPNWRANPQAPGFAEAPPPFPARRPAVAGQEETATDTALLTRLLRLATRNPAPETLAARVIARFGSYARVLAAEPRELFAEDGIGEHSVANMKLIREAALRLLRDGAAGSPVLDEWDSVLAYLTGVAAWERIEQFRILFLDDQGVLLADEAQARGTVNHTPVYPREVAKRALELGAGGLILVHNHPSGDPTPSAPDIDMTQQVCTAVELFGVRVLDHVIIGNGRITSFRAAGLLED